jgi:ribosomal protein L37AE/L43A
MVTELKPCPFCGKNNIIEDDEEVWCDDCGVLTTTLAWNNRPIEDALRVQLEKVEDILREIIAKAGGEVRNYFAGKGKP